MDEVTLVKTRFRKEQWEKLILECQKSGMNVENWCARHDVTKHAYYYWLRKLREKACENLPAVTEESKPVPFKKLEVTAPVPNLDGRCSLSNNAAENAIRPFTVGRKNWLFAIHAGHRLAYSSGRTGCIDAVVRKCKSRMW